MTRKRRGKGRNRNINTQNKRKDKKMHQQNFHVPEKDYTYTPFTVWFDPISRDKKAQFRQAVGYGVDALEVAKEMADKEEIRYSYLSMAMIDTGFPVMKTNKHLVYINSYDNLNIVNHYNARIMLIAIPFFYDTGAFPFYEMETTWSKAIENMRSIVPNEPLRKYMHEQKRINAQYGWVGLTDNYRIFANRYVFEPPKEPEVKYLPAITNP